MPLALSPAISAAPCHALNSLRAMPRFLAVVSSSRFAFAASSASFERPLAPSSKPVKAAKPLIEAFTVFSKPCIETSAFCVSTTLLRRASLFSLVVFAAFFSAFSTFETERSKRSYCFSAFAASPENLEESIPSSRNNVSITVAIIKPFRRPVAVSLVAVGCSRQHSEPPIDSKHLLGYKPSAIRAKCKDGLKLSRR